jgi:hypothetical protein
MHGKIITYITNRSLENVAQFTYLGTTLTNQNLIQEEITTQTRTFLSSRLLSKILKIKICKTLILPVVLHGYETWSLILRETHELRVFENRVLRRIFGP